MAEIDPRISPAAAPRGVGIYERPPPRRPWIVYGLVGLLMAVSLAVSIVLYMKRA